MRAIENSRLQPACALLHQTLWLMGFGETPVTVPLPALRAFVRHHGIAGLINPARQQAVDPTHAVALAQEKRAVALRSLQLGATLKRLTLAMNAQGLHPLVLKGPALALQAHGRLSARGGLDLDILLAEHDWPAAFEVLLDLGYRVGPGQHQPLPSGTHELVFLHQSHLPQVELHRRLLRHQHLLADSATQTEAVDLQGTLVKALDPIHALPYLVAHANQHCFRRLIWLIDIHALLGRADLDMTRVAQAFQRTGTCTILDTCLTLLTELFATPIAPPLQRIRRPTRASQSMAAMARDAICESLSDKEIAIRLGAYRRAALDVTLQDSPSARWHALCDWLSPTGKDNDCIALPARLKFLYPLVRLYRVLRRSS